MVLHEINPGPSVGQAFGKGLENAILPSLQRYNERSEVHRALEDVKKNPGKNPEDTLFKLIEASTMSPEIGRSLGPLYQTLINEQNRNREAQIPLTGNRGVGAQGNALKNNQMQHTQSTDQQGGIGAQGNPPQKSPYFPSNVGPNEAPGNLPQEATGGIVKPIWTGEELLNEAQNLFQKWKSAGINDRTVEDAIKIKEIENRGNEEHNQRVENERLNRIAEQERYGEDAESALMSVLPQATDEQKALFRKKGEEIAGKGKSQADIKRTLAKEATKFKNTISNIQRGLDAPRIQNQLQRSFLGNNKSLDQAEKDAKAQIKPLLDDDLYDTSRNLLANSGFYPEEREKIIFGPISPEMKKSISTIPKPEKVSRKLGPSGTPLGHVEKEDYLPQSKENIKENFKSVWGPEKNNDRLNLLQVRKEYEDKGYDWRIYKDALNDLFSNGDIELNDDQTNQFNSYLDEPPLNLLENILYKLNLRGR